MLHFPLGHISRSHSDVDAGNLGIFSESSVAISASRYMLLASSPGTQDLIVYLSLGLCAYPVLFNSVISEIGESILNKTENRILGK